MLLFFTDRQEIELGAIGFHTEWWVERGLQRLGGLGGKNLDRNVPEIVLANAHLLDDKLARLAGEVRDISTLALSWGDQVRQIGLRDDTSQALHFQGAPSSRKSTWFQDHFGSAESRALALAALRAECSLDGLPSADDDLEVHEFSSASIGGEQVTSLAYTRSTERCGYNVVLKLVPPYRISTAPQRACRPAIDSTYVYATVIRFYLVRHRTTLSVVGRLALVSCYVQLPCTGAMFSGVAHLQEANDNGNSRMIVPLSAISSTCLLHKVEDTIQAVELWGKGKALY